MASKYKAVDELKAYLQRQKDNQYAEIMEKAKQDKKFESMVQDMTLGAISGKSKLTKNKYQY